MSRSIKGAKAPGYDYWSRRPYSGRGFGPSVKDACHRAERMQGKQAARGGLSEAWIDADEDAAESIKQFDTWEEEILEAARMSNEVLA